MGKRCFRLCAALFFLLAAGGCYALLVECTGFGIPCMFRLITGLQCPGCGVTHLCLALLHGNVREAFASNQMLFLLLPVFGILFLQCAVRYIKTGSRRIGRRQTQVIYVCILLLIVFAVVRNLVTMLRL